MANGPHTRKTVLRRFGDESQAEGFADSRQCLAAGVPAMADGCNVHIVFLRDEENAIVTAAQAQAEKRGHQFFHVTDAGGEITVNTVENL
jgi:hypothetical protein